MIRKDDNKLANLLMVGAAICGVSIFIGFFGFLLRSGAMFAFGIVGFFIGVVVAAYTLFSGLRTESQGGKVTTVTEIPGARITARYAINMIGETIFSEQDILFDDPKTKLYVRLQLPNAHSTEVKCPAEVWLACGEGMYGTALLQGDWLGGFRPTVGTGQGDPYRDRS